MNRDFIEEIEGRNLKYYEGKKVSEIKLHEIKKILVQKANAKTRFFNRRAKLPRRNRGKKSKYYEGKKVSEIKLHEIKKILIQKANAKTRFFNRRAKVVAIYDKQENLVMQIPAYCVEYDEFAGYMYEMTNHLIEIPYIQSEA